MQHRESTYGLENAWRDARARLGAIEEWLDPATIRQLDALGVGSGWRCLEVGAGGGSIASWLCTRVGPSGHVVAVDIDTRFLADIDAPNLEVREQDIVDLELPERSVDLVHMRLVLLHLTEQRRAEALRRLVAALKPGGWLLAEEMDFVSAAADPTYDAAATTLFHRLATAHVEA
ncbi:MAG: class I SAM-dependent methyltransferase, partial [Dehalococcoidia bacterium]